MLMVINFFPKPAKAGNGVRFFDMLGLGLFYTETYIIFSITNMLFHD